MRTAPLPGIQALLDSAHQAVTLAPFLGAATLAVTGSGPLWRGDTSAGPGPRSPSAPRSRRPCRRLAAHARGQRVNRLT